MNTSPGQEQRRPRPTNINPKSPLRVQRPVGQRLPWRFIFPIVFLLGGLFGLYLALTLLIPSGTALAAVPTPTPLPVGSAQPDPYDPGAQAALPVVPQDATRKSHVASHPSAVPTLPPDSDNISNLTTPPQAQVSGVPGITGGNVVIAHNDPLPNTVATNTAPTQQTPPTAPPIVVPFIDASAQPSPTETPGSGDSLSTQDVKDLASYTSGHSNLPPLSPYTIQQGTYLRLRPLGTINTEFGCHLTSMVIDDYYDSVNEEWLLIPATTKVISECKGGTVYGQNKVFLVAERLIFPDGESRTLDAFPSADDTGSEGVNASVDQHIGNLVGPAVLLSALQTVTQLSTGTQSYSANGLPQTPAQAAGQSLMQQLDQLGIALTQRALSQAPTLSVDSAEPYNVEVMNDLIFTAPYRPEGVKR